VQLLSLEMARRALADAGYAAREFDRAKVGVVFGAEAGNELAGAYGFRAVFPSSPASCPPRSTSICLA
jgi:acyl transferase domain-containing protein